MGDTRETGEKIAFFNQVVEAYLAGKRHVWAEPLDRDTIRALASGEIDGAIEAFRAAKNGDLSPVILKARMFRGAPSFQTTFARDAVGRLDRSRPLGVRLSVRLVDVFGAHHDDYLFTKGKAEEAAAESGMSDPARRRQTLYLPSTEDNPRAQRLPLVDIYGAEVNFSCIVAGVSPAALEARVREILAAEFGAALNPLMKSHSRAVFNKRVDVYDTFDDTPIAFNVLAAESGYLRDKAVGPIETRRARTDLVLGH